MFVDVSSCGTLHPVESLEFSGERELLRRALRESGQAIGLRVRRATVDNFRYVRHTVEQIFAGCTRFSAVHINTR